MEGEFKAHRTFALLVMGFFLRLMDLRGKPKSTRDEEDEEEEK